VVAVVTAAGASVALASASDAFPGAPQTQAHGYGVATDACPLATPNRYLPARSGCVVVMRADINGDGRPDLILLYSKLSRHHVGGLGASSEFRRDYLAEAAYLTVYLAGGGSATTRIVGTRSAAIIAVSHMSDDPGSEVFLQVSEISSGSAAFVYSFNDGRLVPAGVTLGYGGDSATKAGFNCLADPPRLIQRTFELLGPTIYGWWRETDITYTWNGPKLVRTAARTFKEHGSPPRSEIEVGSGCKSVSG